MRKCVWRTCAVHTRGKRRARVSNSVEYDLPLSSVGGTNSCMTGPSGRYILTGTLRTLYAPSFSAGTSVDEEGRLCIEAEEGGTGGGEFGRLGAVVGVILLATRQ